MHLVEQKHRIEYRPLLGALRLSPRRGVRPRTPAGAEGGKPARRTERRGETLDRAAVSPGRVSPDFRSAPAASTSVVLSFGLPTGMLHVRVQRVRDSTPAWRLDNAGGLDPLCSLSFRKLAVKMDGLLRKQGLRYTTPHVATTSTPSPQSKNPNMTSQFGCSTQPPKPMRML